MKAALDVLFEWAVPAALFLFFVAGAWTNADALFGLSRGTRETKAAGGHVSVVPALPGIAGAVALANAPSPELQAWALLPLVFDVGCIPYLALVMLAGGASALARGGTEKNANPLPIAEQSAQTERMKHLERAAAGCILGTAVGDALGLACEGLSRERQRRLFPDIGRYHFLFGYGMCSDDTEHTCMLAQSLIASAAGRDIDYHANTFAADFARRLRLWLLGVPAGIGWGTLRAILKLWLFIPPRWSGVHSAGNGPAMRSALLGVCFGGERERLRAFVRVATRITHTDPKAEYAALAVALAAHLAATEGTVAPTRYREELAACLDAGGGELLALVERIEQYHAEGRAIDDYVRWLGCAAGVSGYAYHTVPAALYAWLAHPGDYRAAVLAAIRCGGDTDTVAAIVGAIAGSGAGKEGIPGEWLAKLREWPRTVQWMERLSARLAHACAQGHGEPPLPVSAVKLVLRNACFIVIVLMHGFRRLLPPY